MARQWTFGRRVAAGFAVMVLITLIIGAVAITAVNRVGSAKDRVIAEAVQRQVNAERLRGASAETVISIRAFLLTGESVNLQQAQRSRAEFAEILRNLRTRQDGRPASVALLDAVERAEVDHQAATERLVELRRGGAPLEQVAGEFEAEALPLRQALGRQIDALRAQLEDDLVADREAASAAADRANLTVLAIALLAAALGAVLAVLLTRSLGRQIAGVVGHIQSSSAELEAAAAQQANGARDQATAMSEITTTINELLITSRQIVESAQRVSRVAEETASAARAGDASIEDTRASIAAIRRQVDLIVSHMLELGEKSQQIGGIVDVVSELAEQTNILAINATIEASGAGEWGRRFAVVADEIRKLADRTAGSAKEIRDLIDDVRGAVNTTVMATETGAKAVDAGARRFDETAESFRRISGLVATTTDAAREIELSTKQQTGAVEQANAAVADTARVTRETEASATQTRQTATHLTGLSASLMRLVSAKSGG